MRVVKGVGNAQGTIDIVGTSPSETIDSKNALFILGGRKATKEKIGYLEGYFQLLKPMLEDASDELDIYAVAYDNYEKNSEEMLLVNADATHTNQEVEAFVDDYLLPMLEEGNTTITLWCHSYGSSFAEMSRRVLIQRLEDRGASTEDIRHDLRRIMLIAVAGVANTMDDAHGEGLGALEFSTIHLNSQQDIGDQQDTNKALRHRQHLLEERHMQEEVVISPLSGNRIEVTIPVSLEGAAIPRWNAAKRSMEKQPHDPTRSSVPGHQPGFYLFENEATHPGAVDFVRGITRYAVTRPHQAPPDLLQKALEVKRNVIPYAEENDAPGVWSVYVRTKGAADRGRG